MTLCNMIFMKTSFDICLKQSLPIAELQHHSLLKREPSAHPTNGKYVNDHIPPIKPGQIRCKEYTSSTFSAALRRLSSCQAQAVPPPLPPRLSLSQMASMPAGQLNSSQQRIGETQQRIVGESHQRIGEPLPRIGESHPRLARLSSSHQPSLPRILSSVHGEPSINYMAIKVNH